MAEKLHDGPVNPGHLATTLGCGIVTDVTDDGILVRTVDVEVDDAALAAALDAMDLDWAPPYRHAPLPPHGIRATLDAIYGPRTLAEAALGSGFTEQQLTDEAMSWAAAEAG